MQATSAIQAWPQGTRLLSLLCSHLHQMSPVLQMSMGHQQCPALGNADADQVPARACRHHSQLHCLLPS